MLWLKLNHVSKKALGDKSLPWIITRIKASYSVASFNWLRPNDAYMHQQTEPVLFQIHDDVIKWKHFLRHGPAGNSPVTCESPAQGPVTQNVDVFFDLVIWDAIALIM